MSTPGKPDTPAASGAKPVDSLGKFEELVASLAQPSFSFCLCVAGATPRSTAAIANVRRICEQFLPGRYELEVVDVYQNPGLAKAKQVLAVPMLIKELPLPSQSFVGDMSDSERIVIGLNLSRSGKQK